MTVRAAIATFACIVALAAPGYGQSRRWSEPYRQGVKAFEAGDFAPAIVELERAVAADPRAQANKVEEGVYRIDYFPYYYLALAYAELGQFDKALLNLEKARSTVSRRHQARFAATESKIRVALEANAPRRNAAFDSGVRDVEALLNGNQFDAAISKLDELRTMDAAEYGKSGLAARREGAVKALSAQLLGEARASIQASRFKEARARLQRAEALQPGQRPVSELVAELTKRDDEYQRLTAAAQADITAGNYASARSRLQQAQNVQPELFASDDVARRLTETAKLAGKPTTTPAGTVATSNKVDAERVERNSLPRTPEGAGGEALPTTAGLVPTASADSSRLALRDGLLALLKGDAQGSIAILEPAAAGANTAPLHAYLGVAYATRALSATNPDARATLREKAVQAFKLAQAAEPAYQLSSRIVSPAILAIYQSARR